MHASIIIFHIYHFPIFLLSVSCEIITAHGINNVMNYTLPVTKSRPPTIQRSDSLVIPSESFWSTEKSKPAVVIVLMLESKKVCDSQVEILLYFNIDSEGSHLKMWLWHKANIT